MAIHIVKGFDGFDRRAFSAEDVRRMVEIGIFDEKDPIELVEGEVLHMSPKGYAHDRIKDALAALFMRGTGSDMAVSVEGTLQLGSDTLIEPDILIHPRASSVASPEGYKVVPSGSVLLAIEIAASSLRYDAKRKAKLYAAHGLPDYWIVDLTKPQIVVHRDPGAGAYGDVRFIAPAETITPIATELGGISIRLADLL